MTIEKDDVREFWEAESCGESLYLTEETADGYQRQAEARYSLEPYIPGFAEFEGLTGKRVLEIGVGLGADHERFVRGGADAIGVDLTLRAVRHTRDRLRRVGLPARLLVSDAENLCFPDGAFQRIYSWGVLHHSPDTARAVAEVWRVLEPGGEARIMIYSKWSIVGLMLWIRYGVLRLRPWIGLDGIYSQYLESPGTKAYTKKSARKLFERFSRVEVETVLTHGDLLESRAGQRHEGPLLSIARAIWPRTVLRRFAPGMGLFMLIRARK